MPSLVPNSIAFYFSRNSPRDTVIAGPGITYEISTPAEFFHPGDRITTVTRVSPDGKKIVVGQFIWHTFGYGTMVKLSESEDWRPISDFLRKQGGRALSHARTFSGAYGIQYRWKARGLRRRTVLTLDNDPNAQGSPPPIAAFHSLKRNLAFRTLRKAYLEVSPRLANTDTLDPLILSFAMFERMKREREKKSFGDCCK